MSWPFAMSWPRARALALALALALAPGLGPLALAVEPGEPSAPPDDGPVYGVSRIEVHLAEAEPGAPDLAQLLPLEVELGRLPTGYVEPRPGVPSETLAIGGEWMGELRYFHASAVGAVARTLLKRVQAEGLVGVYVTPHPADIDVYSERDARPSGQRVLRLIVSIGRVRELRSVAIGDRIDSDWLIDNPIHRRIRLESPIQPTGSLREDTTDLIDRDVLEKYLFQLNRHPGRRVDAALAAAEGGGVALDYRVHEAKPWFVYFQTSNTGTEQTAKWQQRLGFVHRQLTNRDDILSIESVNAGAARVSGINASYEAPWFGPERPKWWKTSGREPGWLSWFDRDKLPWWGHEDLRWRANGSYSRYEATAVSFTDDVEGSEWNASWDLVYQLFQHDALFVDLFAGTHLRSVSVLNTTLASGRAASEFFVLPEIGLEAERFDEVSTFVASLMYEMNVSNTSFDTLQQLGRVNAEGDYKLLHFDLGWSHFLEPLLRPAAWEDPRTASTSTLAHEISLGTRGQYSFGDRLIPQASQIVGGLYSVRGYPQSAAVGDTVVVASAEYRFHLPHALPIQREPVQVPLVGSFRAAPQQVYGRPDWDLILRGFLDVGRTIRYDPPPGSPEVDDTLLGIGAGVELRIRNNFTARVDYGRSLLRTGGADPVPKGNNEVYFLFNVLY